MTDIRPRRSMLYMPGSNARALEKARALPVDALILDLEDAVAPEAKDVARDQVAAAVAARGFGDREVLVRVNGPATPWGEADLAAAIACRPDAILLPKVSAPADLDRAAAALDAADPDRRIALWAMVETPLAILDIRNIAATARAPGARLAGFVLGTNDLAKDTGARLVPGRAPMTPWLMIALAAARAFGVAAIDGVYNDVDDDAGFAAECAEARDMGFDGKTLVHPRQIGPANAAFTPTAEEVAFAEAVVQTFARPENAGRGVLRVEGRMVERLHAEMAARTLAMMQTIAARDTAPV
ncbi:MAG TPA: CoA ester lyase [Methylomirabilota bacterium]|nr:CoA ester lyase [Methylomirabilota bacterium]